MVNGKMNKVAAQYLIRDLNEISVWNLVSQSRGDRKVPQWKEGNFLSIWNFERWMLTCDWTFNDSSETFQFEWREHAALHSERSLRSQN